MFGKVQDRRWTRRGPGAITIGAVAVAAVAITSAAWPVSGSLAATRPRSGGPSIGRTSAAIPANWAPVTFQRARLSVPGGWFVEDPGGFFCLSKNSSMIFVGMTPRIPKGEDPGPGCHHLHPNYAWIVPARHIPPGINHRKPTAVINGIPVYRVSGTGQSVVYLVPELGVRVGAHGPKAKRILATLNRSPLAVVLAKGPDSPVPAHWVRRQFGGLRFATPRGWHPSHASQWATCGTGVNPHSLDLINAKKPPEALPCPFPIPTARAIEAVHGLTVVTGKFAARSVDEIYPRCQVHQDTRICLSAKTGTSGLLGSVLIFSVSKPHHHARTFVLLGLAATGAEARAVFDSISVR
jgi:hypothetical protein